MDQAEWASCELRQLQLWEPLCWSFSIPSRQSETGFCLLVMAATTESAEAEDWLFQRLNMSLSSTGDRIEMLRAEGPKLLIEGKYGLWSYVWRCHCGLELINIHKYTILINGWKQFLCWHEVFHHGLYMVVPPKTPDGWWGIGDGSPHPRVA